jgi:DNA polymerase-3 subunit gamma/tau
MLNIESKPKTWNEIKFQDHVVKVLQTALINKKEPNVILLEGTSGIGKTSIGIVYAASVLCNNRAEDGSPCGVCPNCADIFSESYHRNIRYINGVADSGIDFYREAIKNLLDSQTVFGSRKVLIVDEIHGLSKESLDLLLLPIESKKNKEIFFIFATTESSKIKDTLGSRCLTFKLKQPDGLAVSTYIMEKLTTCGARIPKNFLTEGAVEIAMGSNGNVRTALTILDKVLLSKDFSVENIQSQSDTSSDKEVLSIMSKIINGSKTGYLDFNRMVTKADATEPFNKMVANMSAVYRFVCAGVSLGKPYYENLISQHFNKKDNMAIAMFMEVLLDVKKTCGYYIDKYIFEYKIISKFQGFSK